MKLFSGLLLPLIICVLPLLLFFYLKKLKIKKGYKASLLFVGGLLILVSFATPLLAVYISQESETYHNAGKRIACDSGSSVFFILGIGILFALIPLTILSHLEYRKKCPKQGL